MAANFWEDYSSYGCGLAQAATCDSQVPVKRPEYPVSRGFLRLRRRAKSFESGRAGWRLARYESDELPGRSTPRTDVSGCAGVRQTSLGSAAATGAAAMHFQVCSIARSLTCQKRRREAIYESASAARVTD